MGILQARILECVAMPSSRESSQPRDWIHLSYVSCVGKRVLYHWIPNFAVQNIFIEKKSCISGPMQFKLVSFKTTTYKIEANRQIIFQFSSVESLSHVWLFATLWITACQASLSITNSRVHSNSCPSSQWIPPAISSSVVPFSSCPQSLPASEFFPMCQLFAWGGQSIEVSALASFLPENTQDWSPLEWTGWISLQSKGLSRVSFNTTVQKHQFFSAQLSSQSNSHIHPWPQEKP